MITSQNMVANSPILNGVPYVKAMSSYFGNRKPAKLNPR
jgi:hypothetical protein